ncbi:MAG: nucleotide exchange factor GrpE [Anaerolineae bacterium]|nr:nucleotide exchange factor GrpE [Anaerolineae bacterium]
MIGRWWRRGEDETPDTEPKTPSSPSTPDSERPATPSQPEQPLPTPPPQMPIEPPAQSAPDTGVNEQLAALAAKVDGLAVQLARLAREQLRANEISERALREARESAALARAAVDRPPSAMRDVREVRLPTGRPALPINGPAEPAAEPEQKAMRVLESLMPVLDAIEAGLESGKGQLERLSDAQARTLLAAWLDGQRLLRERILSLFEREGIRPIDALGQRFDPFRHVAVERSFDPLRLPGTVISERRRGFEANGRVLRFAEVIVTTDRPENGQ